MTAPLEAAVMPTDAVLAAYRRHRMVLEVARTDRTREDYPTLADEALSAPEASEAVIADLRGERIEIIWEALTYGTGIDEVCNVLGRPPEKVVTEVQECADTYYLAGLIDHREWRRLRRLLIGGVL